MEIVCATFAQEPKLPPRSPTLVGCTHAFAYISRFLPQQNARPLIITIRNPENPLTTISSSLAYWVCGHVSLFVREDNGSLPTRTILVLLACLIMQIPDIIYHLTWEARCPINCVREIIKPS